MRATLHGPRGWRTGKRRALVPRELSQDQAKTQKRDCQRMTLKHVLPHDDHSYSSSLPPARATSTGCLGLLPTSPTEKQPLQLTSPRVTRLSHTLCLCSCTSQGLGTLPRPPGLCAGSEPLSDLLQLDLLACKWALCPPPLPTQEALGAKDSRGRHSRKQSLPAGKLPALPRDLRAEEQSARGRPQKAPPAGRDGSCRARQRLQEKSAHPEPESSHIPGSAHKRPICGSKTR